MHNSSSAQELAELPEDIGKICSLGSLIESRIGHEIALIGHRIQWLVVSESFLFGAFATILASRTDSYGSSFSKAAIVYMLPILGMLLAMLAWISVLQALRVSEALLKTRGNIDRTLTKRIASLDWPHLGLKREGKGLRGTDFWGKTSAFCVPPLLAMAWLYLFLMISIKAGGSTLP